jgi:hypothetical protein
MISLFSILMFILAIVQAAPPLKAHHRDGGKIRLHRQTPSSKKTDVMIDIVTKGFARPQSDGKLVPRSRFGRFVKAPWSMTPVVAREASINITISFNTTSPTHPLNGTLSADGAAIVNGTHNGNATLVAGPNNSTLNGLNTTSKISLHTPSRQKAGHRQGEFRVRPVRLAL